MHLHQDQPQDPSLPPLFPTSTTTQQQSALPTHGDHHYHHEDDQQSDPKKHAKHLYFAYGSNLSPTQMSIRCIHNPSLSATPVAIAALDDWRWLICQFGYANVVPPPGLRVGRQVTEGSAVPESVSPSLPGGGVFGVLYEMDWEDEEVLDGYEGVDGCATLSGGEGEVPGSIRPTEQGDGLYNKWYIGARIVRWLDEGYRERNGFEVGGKVRVLVYIDELRVRVGDPKDEYIPRMNRAIREAVELGFPEDWAEAVMRPSLPKQ
ncbi:gamma-glutamylcyclotransferase family protein [Aspergillus lucknowensis]|uniref:gamma-glutamylcyclotransferase n=1 Tax=Aspergillus lucknowensis TaxID=176173 RepID=A0ABR4LK27_9EURO